MRFSHLFKFDAVLILRARSGMMSVDALHAIPRCDACPRSINASAKPL